ncbi:MAG: acetyl-CoA hydrolase/transferase family protein [Bacillota bacterium]
MVNWKDYYMSRLTTAAEAVQSIKSGQKVVLTHACGEAQALSAAMAARAADLENVEVIHMVAMGKALYCLPEMAGHFRHNSLFVGAASRSAVNEGRADFTPVFFSEIPRLFNDGYIPVDVLLAHVSPPDNNGFCSLGISVDYTLPAARCARMVIAQVNRNMPRTHGNTFMHVSSFQHIVECDEELIELPRPRITEVEERIGGNVAELVEDGSTLQLGIGALPDAVLLFLKNKHDLGIHSEMFSDGVIDLYEEGVITGREKTLHRDKMIATFLMGTRRLYDFVNDNPAVEMHSVDYVNDPFVISRNSKMVSINSALQVDLVGQVCADTIGTKQFSAVGGQVDFIRGASRSAGGKAIIAMPSTAGGGKFSRIVDTLDQGASVTTSRFDVHYIVTEYGIANLRGKTIRQRARELIKIAHPDFRDQLEYAARKRHLL